MPVIIIFALICGTSPGFLSPSGCDDLFFSRGYRDLARHEVCMQLYLEKFAPPRIQILDKGRLAWSRDGWLTNSMWSHKDFMFHGWQLKRKDRLIFARWHPPLLEGPFNLKKCSDPLTAGEQWRYLYKQF